MRLNFCVVYKTERLSEDIIHYILVSEARVNWDLCVWNCAARSRRAFRLSHSFARCREDWIPPLCYFGNETLKLRREERVSPDIALETISTSPITLSLMRYGNRDTRYVMRKNVVARNSFPPPPSWIRAPSAPSPAAASWNKASVRRGRIPRRAHAMAGDYFLLFTLLFRSVRLDDRSKGGCRGMRKGSRGG